jgi:hypothetical protein
MEEADRTAALKRLEPLLGACSADFTPLSFAQRFVGAFSEDGNVIDGAWEKSQDGSTWEKDFDLTYRRAR